MYKSLGIGKPYPTICIYDNYTYLNDFIQSWLNFLWRRMTILPLSPTSGPLEPADLSNILHIDNASNHWDQSSSCDKMELWTNYWHQGIAGKITDLEKNITRNQSWVLLVIRKMGWFKMIYHMDTFLFQSLVSFMVSYYNLYGAFTLIFYSCFPGTVIITFVPYGHLNNYVLYSKNQLIIVNILIDISCDI